MLLCLSKTTANITKESFTVRRAGLSSSPPSFTGLPCFTRLLACPGQVLCSLKSRCWLPLPGIPSKTPESFRPQHQPYSPWKVFPDLLRLIPKLLHVPTFPWNISSLYLSKWLLRPLLPCLSTVGTPAWVLDAGEGPGLHPVLWVPSLSCSSLLVRIWFNIRTKWIIHVTLKAWVWAPI